MFRHAPAGYDCPFCRLAMGDFADLHTIPDDVVATDDGAIAFLSSRWWGRNEGHVLVIPRQHFENLYEITDDALLAVHRMSRRIAIALKDAYDCDGTSTRQHNEPHGGQDVWHYHVHVFPRWEGLALYGATPRDSTPEERAPYAAKLRAALR